MTTKNDFDVFQKNTHRKEDAMFSKFFPPTGGMKAWYKCRDCGKQFWATVPIFAFLGSPKCPDCDSRKTVLDNMVTY